MPQQSTTPAGLEPSVRERRRARNARLWRRWRRHGEAAARELLIEGLMPLARATCRRRVQAGVPSFMDPQDMVSAAYVALIGAVESYEPGHGASIESFAARRCEGAVLDWMREASPSSRGLQEYERDRDALHSRLGREPSPAEVAAALELPAETVHRREIERVACRTVPLHAVAGADAAEDPGARAPADVLAAGDRRTDPPAAMELRDRTRLLLGAMTTLTPAQRAAVIGPELHGAPLRDVGAQLGVSVSRVAELRRQARRRLRAELDPHRELALAA